MLSIPLPFIAAFLLALIVVVLKIKDLAHWKIPTGFILLCILTMIIVGLRWSLNYPFLRALQPIFGACLPVTAWLSFSRAHRHSAYYFLHWIGPFIVALISLSYPYLWPALVDYLVPLLSLFYGGKLLKSSFYPAEDISINQLDRVSKAERITGLLLIFSALTDSVISYDFFAFNGIDAQWILSLSYLVMIPIITAMVIVVSTATSIHTTDPEPQEKPRPRTEEKISARTQQHQRYIDHDEISLIAAQFETFMTKDDAFKDADLTLNRIARKLGIPTRKISSAVNQKYGENISKVINSYRVEHAKHLLTHSDMSVTDIFLSSGFQTKSNFHREFSRITGQTPSEYRQTHPGS